MTKKKVSGLEWFLIGMVIMLIPFWLYYMYEPLLGNNVLEIKSYRNDSNFIVNCTDGSFEMADAKTEEVCGRKIDMEGVIKLAKAKKKETFNNVWVAEDLNFSEIKKNGIE